MNAAPPPLILIVDDNDAARYVKTRVLTLAGLRVAEASSGQEALQRCAAERPDLVLLDVKLPDLNGLEVCRRLKADPHTRGAIVLQTSAAMTETAHRVRALEAGADSYLVEPIEPEELVANVRALLRLKRAEESSRRAESALQASEARFQRFAESVKDVFWIYDHNQGRFTYLSPAFERLFGQGVDEVLADPKTRFARVHPQDRERVERRFGELPAIGVFEEEYRVIQSDGAERWVADRAFPGYDEAGEISCYTGIAQDATLRKEAELVLINADRQKDEFIAMLAHELRSPLAPLRSAADYLQMSGDLRGERDRHALAIVKRQVDHLAHLVDDLLDVSRISQGKIHLKKASVTLRSVVSTAVDAVRTMIEGKCQRLRMNLPAEEVWLYGDAVRLAQIFSNLLHNASKFTPEGGSILINARAHDRGVQVEVVDNGAGIRAEVLPHVFDLFTQDPLLDQRAHGGLGIGLSLVKQLVELHEGEVRVDSEGVGRGTSFTVRLKRHEAPAEVASDAGEGRGMAAGRAPKKVLVVDDNPDAAEAMAMLLAAGGHDVQCAHDGSKALQTAARDLPDVVLLDIGLPEMDGYQVAKGLRALPAFEHVKLIAVSGHGSELDKQLALASGFNHHLTKPVDFDQLLALITA